MGGNDDDGDSSRRTVLKGLAATGTALSLGAGPAAGRDADLLGGQGGGLAWETPDPNELSRTDEAGFLGRGTHAVRVDVRGDAPPVIATEDAVREADLRSRPHLLADVVPAPDGGVDSEFVFSVRLHAEGADGPVVEQSPETVVEPGERGRISWDASGLPDSVLASPRRLEVAWFLADHPPDYGYLEEGYDHGGTVVFEHVRLSEDGTDAPEVRIRKRMRARRLAHGRIVETDVQSRTDTEERGEYVFADGTRVPYVFEVLDDGFRYLVDGEEFELGGEPP